MKHSLFYFFVVMISYSCANEEGLLKVMPERTDDKALSIDTVRVETPGTTREFPYRFPSYNYSNSAFAGLDERTNTINVYDLSSFKIRDSIRLHDAGPHEVPGNMVGSVWYHNSDSIFVLQHVPSRLLIVNSNAEIIWQRDLGEIFKDKKALNGLTAYALFDRVTLYYRKGKAYFGLRQNQADQDFLNPMMGYYDFENDDIRTLDIHYPEFYTSNDDVGSYHFPNITWYGDSILIVFPYSPEIFIYDLDGYLQTHVQKPTEFAIGEAPEPGQSERSHLFSNPLYLGILPVRDGQYYVLYSQEETPLDREMENYQATIVYNRDFKKYFVFDKNTSAISFGGEYFYYPILHQQTEYQLLERYRVEIE